MAGFGALNGLLLLPVLLALAGPPGLGDDDDELSPRAAGAGARPKPGPAIPPHVMTDANEPDSPASPPIQGAPRRVYDSWVSGGKVELSPRARSNSNSSRGSPRAPSPRVSEIFPESARAARAAADNVAGHMIGEHLSNDPAVVDERGVVRQFDFDDDEDDSSGDAPVVTAPDAVAQV